MFDAFSIRIENINRNNVFGPFFTIFFCFIINVQLDPCYLGDYSIRVSQRENVVTPKIKAKFNALGLSQRATTCPFRQFFLAPVLKFFGQLIHQLLLRKVRSSDNGEMKFLISGQILRFGLVEFTLIIGLNFGQYSSLAEITQMSSSTRLCETYMHGDVHPKLVDFENAFLSCQDVEDC